MGSLAPQPQPSPEPETSPLNPQVLWNAAADQPDQLPLGDQDFNSVADGLPLLGPSTQLKPPDGPDDLPRSEQTADIRFDKPPKIRLEKLPATGRERSRLALLADEEDDGQPQGSDKPGISGGTPELEIEQQLRGLVADPRYPKDPHFAAYVTKQFERAYPGTAEPDASGRISVDAPPALATLDPYMPPDTPVRPEPGADAQVGDDEHDIVRWLQAKAARDRSGTSDSPLDPSYQLAQAIPIPSGPAGTPVPGAPTPDVAPYQAPDWMPDFLRRPLTPEAVQDGADAILEGMALPRLGHPYRSGSRMDPAPDLPPLPPSEPPPDRPDTGTEVFPDDIPIYAIPGLEIPDVKEPQVLIFPDLSGENDPSSIVESRRGNDATRAHIDAVRDEVLRQHPDWKHVGGGTTTREDGTQVQVQEYRIPGPAGAFKDPETGRYLDSRPGSNFLDLTFELPDGRHVHVQTVDIDRNGKPSADELEAAYRVFRATGESVYLIPKPWQVRDRRR